MSELFFKSIVSRTLQFALHCLATVILAVLSSVRGLTVTRVYCDKTTEVRITRFSHKSGVKS